MYSDGTNMRSLAEYVAHLKTLYDKQIQPSTFENDMWHLVELAMKVQKEL